MFAIKTWNIEEMTGYKPISTFYEDFSIADRFGTRAIKSTYKQAFSEWKDDYKMVTELCMVLNWKTWEHQSRPDLCDLYCNLFYQLQEWCYSHLKGNELDYFIRTTD